jgi:membrane-bound serine protease (ClpP class)
MLLGGIALAQEKPDVEVKPQEAKPTDGKLEFEPVEPKPVEELKGYDAGGGAGKSIYTVPIEGTIDLGLAPFVERVTDQASAGDVIFIDMNTFGGRVDGAVRIRDALLNAEATTVVFISGRAISAGALISLACDTIIMGKGATIGDAMPVKLGSDGQSQATGEKAISYFREEMAATAKAKGRRGDLARSMVDPDIEIKGVIGAGKLLTLSADDALGLGIADALVENAAEAVTLLNLGKAERIEMHTSWAEKIARMLTDPIVSSLLMTFGVLGLLMEFYTPGFGVGGIIGLCCLAAFFLGQYTAHLAGMEELLLLTLGLVLLGLEIFVIPGFGIAGVAGILCTGAAMVMALVELNLPLDVSMDLGYAQAAASTAVIRIAILMVAVGGATLFFAKYFPETRLGKRMILASTTGADAGYVSQSKVEDDLVGKRGVAKGMLRPAGIAEVEGKRIDVVAEGDYIKAGVEIEVTRVDGNRVVVKRV